MDTLHRYSNFDNRDKAVFAGLFLSRFSKKALEAFGFTSYRQAYNVLGYSLGVRPNSINNYRDEFDPFFDNGRQGWHNREQRDYCKSIMIDSKDLTFEQFVFIINSYLSNNGICLEDIANVSPTRVPTFSAQRLVTGKAAEQYFEQNYQSVTEFSGYSLKNTTALGCGFDYKLTNVENRYYVEVKGLNEKTGNILMTEKEHDIASELKDKYCLFVVRNFREKPIHQCYFNPLNCGEIIFTKREQQTLITSYHGSFL